MPHSSAPTQAPLQETTLSPATSPRVIVLLPNEPLRCPAGHALPKNTWVIGEEPRGGERCKFRPPPGNVGECGLTVFWWRQPDGKHVVVRCSSLELHEMERQHMNVEEARNFLGLTWPLVAPLHRRSA